nr:Chain D, HISTONE H3.1 [Mus musculus]2XL3_F Chain F, HISTONE H3.1 [Mus musculus]
ARTKQTARY